MNNILIIAVSFLLGFMLKFVKFGRFNFAKTLNILIVYISLPSLILLKIPYLHISNDTLAPIVLPWVITFITSILVLLIAKKYNLKKEETGSLLLVGILGNTSFLGVPVIQLFFGESYVPYALIYDQLGSFLILSTYGSVVVALYSQNSIFDIKEIAKKVILFPPFLSLIVAFIIRGIQYNSTIIFLLQNLSSTLVPFALLSVGYQLHLKVPKHERKALFIAILTKTVFAPLIALIICLIFTNMNNIVKVSILEAGMGPMITAGIMANLANLAPRLTNAIVGYGILFSLITLPVFYIIILKIPLNF